MSQPSVPTATATTPTTDSQVLSAKRRRVGDVTTFNNDSTLQPCADLDTKANDRKQTSLPDPSAMQKVFGIVELREKILLGLSLRDLFCVIRVSKTFEQTIAGSRKLRRAMWLEAKAEWPTDLGEDTSDDGVIEGQGCDENDATDESFDDAADGASNDNASGGDHDEGSEFGSDDESYWCDDWPRLNPLMVPREGLDMQRSLADADCRISNYGHMMIVHLELLKADIQDWVSQYGKWQPSGASWEQTVMVDRPVKVIWWFVVLDKSEGWEYRMDHHVEDGNSTVGEAMEEFRDWLVWLAEENGLTGEA